MGKLVVEMLEEINEDPKRIEQYKDNGALRQIFEYAFLPEKKFILPDGDPPFTQNPAPLAMADTNLLMELRRLYIFCRADLSPAKRESLFISLLEGIHPSEAKVMLAIKDQALHKLYKKITHKLVADVGFVPPPLKKERKSPAKKSKNSEEPA